MDKFISKANQWANKIWIRAFQSWEKRSQDRNYRDVVARPAILSALKSLQTIKNGKFFDIGCGDGAETFYIRDVLSQLGNSGTMYGYDNQSDFIMTAISANNQQTPIPIQFGNGPIDKFLERYRLSNNVNLITSIFVLQELPDIHKYLNIINKVLNKNGAGIFLLVHPLFAEAMKDKNALKINDSLSPMEVHVPWRFAGEYPIVEEKVKTFFVPYFHRTVDDYSRHFQRYFREVDFVSLKPTVDEIKLCGRSHKSPFYNHDGNVYYPEIVEMESSLIVIAKK